MSPKKGYMEIGGYFYLGTHIKCGRSVTFILLAVKFSYIKVYSVELDIVMLRFYYGNWVHYVKEILKNVCMFFFVFFLFLLTHSVYFCIGCSKKFQSCNLRDEYLELFPAWVETSVHFAGLVICCVYIKQPQPELKLSNNLKRRHIAFNLVVSRLFRT